MRQKVPNIYKNEIFKIRLTMGFVEEHEETGEERWVEHEEGIIGLNKFDGFEIMKKWVDMYYSPKLNVWGGHTIDDPQQLLGLAKTLWDKENVTEFTPNKSMTINILEHPGDGKECELTAKVISVNFGHKISKTDAEALVNL